MIEYIVQYPVPPQWPRQEHKAGAGRLSCAGITDLKPGSLQKFRISSDAEYQNYEKMNF